jgi:photosystem II stability/assembly factor-like uncharacterized protein
VWTPTGPAGGPIPAVLIDTDAANAPATVYVGTLGSGVFRTTDGGETWMPRRLAGRRIRALVRDPGPPATIYAGVENSADAASGGVFKSQDGGGTWAPLDAGLTNKRVLSLVLDGSTLYAGMDGGGVFKWNGATWTPVSSAGNGVVSPNCANCPFIVLSLATDSRVPGTVYAGTEGAGVYKSTDAGQTWIPRSRR